MLLLPYSPTIRHMPSKYFMFQAVLVVLLLTAGMWHLWIDMNAGNANFYFAATYLLAAWQVQKSQIICNCWLSEE